MDEAQPPELPQQLPAPPVFFREFTAENLGQLRELCTEDKSPSGGQIKESQVGYDIAVDKVPETLRYLVPPKIPEDGDYASFGDQHKLSGPATPNLEDYEVERLLPRREQSSTVVPASFPPDFINVTRSLLLNFLELNNILAANPSQAPEKVEDLRVLFLNVHQMLNEHRPHQARETLLGMMQARVDGLRKQIADVHEMQTKVDDLLRSVGNVGEGQLTTLPDAVSRVEQHPAQRRINHARSMWKSLDAIELG